MRTVHLLPVAILATSVLGNRLPAQGTRGPLVRVSHAAACCATPITGTLIAATPDSIRIRPGGVESSAGPITLSRHSVQRFERGERVGGHAVVGAIVGFLTGALAGGAIGYAADCRNCESGNFAQPAGLLLGGLVGIISGIRIGSRIPSYVWEQSAVPLGVSAIPGSLGDSRFQLSLGR